MNEIKRSIKIKARVNKVFEYASNYQNWPEFFVGVSDVKPITEKNHSNGAKFIYRVKAQGMKVTVGTKFQQFRENEGWIGKSFKGIPYQTQWIFERINNNTQFTFVQNYKFPFYFGGKLIDKMFAQPEWINIIEHSLQNVKRIVEAKLN